MKNSFQEMEEQHAKNFHENGRSRHVQNKLVSTVGSVRFFGNVADVYLGRLVDTLIGFGGGKSNDNTDQNIPDRSRNTDPAPNKRYPNQ